MLPTDQVDASITLLESLGPGDVVLVVGTSGVVYPAAGMPAGLAMWTRAVERVCADREHWVDVVLDLPTAQLREMVEALQDDLLRDALFYALLCGSASRAAVALDGMRAAMAHLTSGGPAGAEPPASHALGVGGGVAVIPGEEPRSLANEFPDRLLGIRQRAVIGKACHLPRGVGLRVYDENALGEGAERGRRGVRGA